VNDRTPKIYLSRRNLLALLSKLDRDAAGEDTHCAIIKHQQPSPSYKQTMDTVMIVAVQDEEYYGSQERGAGEMHPADEIKLGVPSSGIDRGGVFE
jgi:hypothetical protein